MIANYFELLNSICEKLNLPKTVFSVELNVSVDEAPALFVGMRITEEEGEALGEILEEYELRLREDPVEESESADPQPTVQSSAVAAFKEQEAADDIERDRASKSHT